MTDIIHEAMIKIIKTSIKKSGSIEEMAEIVLEQMETAGIVLDIREGTHPNALAEAILNLKMEYYDAKYSGNEHPLLYALTTVKIDLEERLKENANEMCLGCVHYNLKKKECIVEKIPMDGDGIHCIFRKQIRAKWNYPEGYKGNIRVCSRCGKKYKKRKYEDNHGHGGALQVYEAFESVTICHKCCAWMED